MVIPRMRESGRVASFCVISGAGTAEAPWMDTSFTVGRSGRVAQPAIARARAPAPKTPDERRMTDRTVRSYHAEADRHQQARLSPVGSPREI